MLNSRQGKTPPSSSAAGMVLLRRRTGQPSDALEKLFGTIVFRRDCPGYVPILEQGWTGVTLRVCRR